MVDTGKRQEQKTVTSSDGHLTVTGTNNIALPTTNKIDAMGAMVPACFCMTLLLQSK